MTLLPLTKGRRAAKKVGLLSAILLALCIGTLTLLVLAYVNRPRSGFYRLLDGDGRITISSLVISGQGAAEVSINDPLATAYLTKAFRSAQRGSYRLGTTYAMEVHLSSLGKVRCAIYVDDDPHFITLAYPLDGLMPDSMQYYLVELPDPVPKPLLDLLLQLRK